MFSAKKPSKRNFRRRVDVENDEETIDGKNGPSSTVEKKTIEKKPRNLLSFDANEAPTVVEKERKPQSLLSFGNDDEEEDETEVFQVKKSAESRRLVKLVERDKRQKRVGAKAKPIVQTSAPGEYTPERLAALRTAQAAPAVEKSKFSNVARVHAPASLSEIPDAAMIHAARKKRELARRRDQETPTEAEIAADFLPLNKNEEDDENDGGNGKGRVSRLVREADDDRSDDDGGDGDGDRESRLGLGSVSEKYVRGKERLAMRTALRNAEDGGGGDDGDDDDELERWEEEQMRKGGAVPQTIQPEDYDALAGALGVPVEASFIPLGENEPPVDVESIAEQLRMNLRAVQEVRSQLTGREDQFGRDGADAERMAGTLESQSAEVGQRYNFYQGMRGYVRDLLQCLHEKLEEIDDIEASYHELLRQRADQLRARRRQNVAEEAELYDPAKQSSREGLSDKEKEARRERAERKTSRRRDRRRRQKQTDGASHYDGMSTDDEETESEIESFQTETESLLERRDDVFDDVHEDFYSLDVIIKRFEEWRLRYPSAYSEAYIDLCLPRVFAPFIRLEMIEWNPLEENCIDFEQSDWFETLSSFGLDAKSGESIDGVDLLLVPRVVEKVLVAKLSFLIENVWNVLSARQTKRLVSLILKLVDEYPTMKGTSKAVQILSSSIQSAIKKALENDVYLPLYPKSLLEDKSTGAYSFVEQQFWSSVKLLETMSQWHSFLPASVLQELCIDSVINRYLLLGLQYSTSTLNEILLKCEKIFAILPIHWFESLKGNRTLKIMEPLCRFCLSLASRFDRAGRSSQDQATTRSYIKRIARMLESANEIEGARQVAGTCL